jgi:glucose-1-phosphate cytidylyltransferase
LRSPEDPPTPVLRATVITSGRTCVLGHRREVVVKVVLFAGGRGLRMRDGRDDVPKPLALVDGKPMLWHVMSWYADQGHTDFVVCTGHRAAEVRRTVLTVADPSWRVRCVDTGLDTPVGQRLLKVRRHVEGEPVFLANYTDLLSDVCLQDVVDRLLAADAAAALVAVRPQASFHLVQVVGKDLVTSVGPVTAAPMWQNGGFFALTQSVFDVIGPGEDLVDEPFNRLAAAGRLVAHPHEGFWLPMDTQKDRARLQAMLDAGQRPWAVPLAAGGPLVVAS